MFAHRFFGARYFGARYWGPSLPAAVVVDDDAGYAWFRHAAEQRRKKNEFELALLRDEEEVMQLVCTALTIIEDERWAA